MALSEQIPTRTLTVYLTKPGTTESELLGGAKLKTTTIPMGRHVEGILHSQGSGLGVPRWTAFFGDTIDPGKLGLRSASASALLAVEIKNRLFALPFGYGRSFVNREVVDDSFGLRVTLNCVPEGNIRSIDRKTFEGITTHVREQASKEAAFGDFGLNVERDLLRAVVGKPLDPAEGHRMAGMDALSLTVRTNLENLPELLQRYLEHADDDSYKKRHPWIDNIAEVRDPQTIARLNEELVRQLTSGNLDRKWLAVPDLIEWNDVGGFRYTLSGRAPLEDDIHLNAYLAQLRDKSALNLAMLKRHKVYAFSATTEQQFNHWPVFNCIYAEIDLKGTTYLLNNGEWYRIDRGFVAEVDAAIEQIPETKITLLPYGASEHEEAYNRRLAKSLSGSCLMDQKNVSHGGGKSKIEFCDVLTDAKQLIHVKRYSGSAVLSHLFAQGTVSATAFVSDAEFRKKLNSRLCAAHRLSDPAHRPRASSWEVAYVVASKSAKALRLPFFSRVTLRNAVRQLDSLGFHVTLTKVGFAGK